MSSSGPAMFHLKHRGFGLLYVCLLSATPPLIGQKDPAVQRLYDHLSGTWTGTNHSYTTPSVVESHLVINVARDANAEWLDLEYVYATPGGSKPDRHLEHDAFYLSAGTFVREFVRDRSRAGSFRMQLENFSGLLQDGYGEYTARCSILWRGNRTPERIDYHLAPDSWSYEIYVSPDGRTWEKTGDWKLKRTSTPP